MSEAREAPERQGHLNPKHRADTSIQIEIICGNAIHVSGSPIQIQVRPLQFLGSPIHQKARVAARSI